jgi:predicted DNA-binding protein
MKNVSIRLPVQAIARLRSLAHTESLRTGREITWSAMVRQVVEQHLLGDEPLRPAGDASSKKLPRQRPGT